ncbi:MAG: nucleotidyltransferase family protein [Candidatus Omnitrophica bacterium]|nr:nucleotidyltransferase family protein [Candidatus Omnitrophota bacterium]
MKALILAAGYGVRLAAVAKDTPKPLLTVAGKALIDHVVERLRTAEGLSEIVVVTNHKFYGHFTRWAKTPPAPPMAGPAAGRAHAGVPIRVVNDGTDTPEERLGSVGDIHFVWSRERVHDDWLIVGGDNLFDQEMTPFLSFARAKAPAISVGLYDIGDIRAASKFGVCSLDAQGRVTLFQEKPEKPLSTLIATCVYYFPRPTLTLIEEYRVQSNALDAAGSYIQWLAEKKNVYGFQFSGKWYDIGSVESLNDAQQHFK